MPYYSIEFHGKATVWAETEQEAKDMYTDDPSCAGPDEEFYIDHIEMTDDDDYDDSEGSI